MKRLDLDDLPPKLAQLLLGLEEGEELLLVQNGGVAGRLAGGAPMPVEPQKPAEPYTNEKASDIFENFRSMIEDEY